MPDADSYKKALEKAKEDLKLLDEMAEMAEKRRAKLRQVIAVLESLTGSDRPPNGTVTDAIMDILKSKDGYSSAAEVFEGVTVRGYAVTPNTIATLLSRLAKNGQIERGPEGYKWAAFSVEIT